jgi:pimeloyl-ACP methyl ester carboxylesterase
VISASRALAASSLFAAALLLGAAPFRPFDPSPYMHAQQLVDIGGRRLNLYCTGSGSPTVILDTDSDDPALEWRYVQRDVAKRTRVCSYDAAGLGFSDPAPGPRDANAFVNDLHTLLMRAHIAPPYVLTGFSLSGLFDRLYADRYPQQVAGMVLVDPYVIRRNERLAALAPALKGAADTRAFVAWLQMCRDAAAQHRLYVGTKAFAQCMWTTGPGDLRLPMAVRRVLQHQWQRPGAWEDLIAEAQAGNLDDVEITQAQRRYGDLPLIVLIPDVQLDLKDLPVTPEQTKKIASAYDAWEADVAALSSRGVAFVVAGSSHDIAEDRPAAITSAIEEVVDQVRYKRL